ncbi:MAG TPA: DNA polymerase III subunit delta [Burkholderiales bacterium]|nr:DNA polymerase III subunit delta [Burkholderiales bacterium]
MRLRAAQVPEQLEARGGGGLAPVWLIHGDEPLLVLEAADAVRAAARRAGYTEREVLFVERGFDWSRFAGAAASQSLFGEKKIVELRLASGRPPAAAAQALERYCARPSPEVLLLVMMPRPEGAGWWKAGWFAALERAGVVAEALPVARSELPRWISQRLARQRQRASAETLELMADRVEGNLLAAHQEIAKLALLAPEGELAPEAVERAVASVARFDFETLAASLYAGDAARYARALAGLRGEGESAAGLAWRLGDELAALARIKRRHARGASLEKLFAENRIWRGAQARCEAALARLDAERLDAAVLAVARAERAAKGVGRGEAWDALLALGLELRDGNHAAGAAAR